MPKATKKKVENVSLETVLWNCRVALRGVGSTDKNRDAVIGLCFLKFAGDKFEKRRDWMTCSVHFPPWRDLLPERIKTVFVYTW